jgi:hypothetical protein
MLSVGQGPGFDAIKWIIFKMIIELLKYSMRLVTNCTHDYDLPLPIVRPDILSHHTYLTTQYSTPTSIFNYLPGPNHKLIQPKKGRNRIELSCLI